MTLKAKADALAGVLRAKRALDGRPRSGGIAVAGRPPGWKFQRRIDIGEQAWGAAKPTQPKGDLP